METGTGADTAAVPASGHVTAAARADALRQVNRAPARLRIDWLWEWAKVVLIALVLFLVVRAFFVEAFKIPSGSMERTLLVGDFLLVNKLVYGAEIPFTGVRLPAIRAPRRGDVVVFQYPKELDKNYVKRLIGLPGDTLAMRDGRLYRNGVEQDEEGYVTRTQPETDPADEAFRWQSNYLVRTAAALGGEHPSRNNWGPLIVPEASYFVLGDNRDNSADS